MYSIIYVCIWMYVLSVLSNFCFFIQKKWDNNFLFFNEVFEILQLLRYIFTFMLCLRALHSLLKYIAIYANSISGEIFYIYSTYLIHGLVHTMISHCMDVILRKLKTNGNEAGNDKKKSTATTTLHSNYFDYKRTKHFIFLTRRFLWLEILSNFPNVFPFSCIICSIFRS